MAGGFSFTRTGSALRAVAAGGTAAGATSSSVPPRGPGQSGRPEPPQPGRTGPCSFRANIDGQRAAEWPGWAAGTDGVSSGDIGEGSRWCGFRQSGRAQYIDPAAKMHRSWTWWQIRQTRKPVRDPAAPARRPCHKVTPPSGPTYAAGGGSVGYGAMDTPTVVALVLAGLAAIATAVP